MPLLAVDLAKDTGGASFSPDGRLLAVPGQDGTVQVLDASTGAKFTTLRAPDGPYCSPAFSPDGTRIVASACPYVDSAGRAVVWDVASGKRLVLTDPDQDWISGLMFSPDGERLTGRTGGTVAIWDAWTGVEVVKIAGHSSEVFGVSFSRDGSWIATGSKDGTARVWDAATGEELVRLSGHGGLVALVDFSPDGTRLLTGGGDGTARVWDVSDTAGAEVWSEHVATEWVGGLMYDENGTRLVTGDGGGGWVLEPSTGERLTPIGWGYEDASFDPGGGRVAASGTAPVLWIWSPERSSARSRSRGSCRASSTARTVPSWRPASASTRISARGGRYCGTRPRADACERSVRRTLGTRSRAWRSAPTATCSPSSASADGSRCGPWRLGNG